VEQVDMEDFGIKELNINNNTNDDKSFHIGTNCENNLQFSNADVLRRLMLTTNRVKVNWHLGNNKHSHS
jgi:hypothetical protein